MYTGRKSKIYPSDRQKNMLEKAFGASRFIYNWGLKYKTERYAESREIVPYRRLKAEMNTTLKEANGWLNEINDQILEASLLTLRTAFQNYSHKDSEFPVFKSKNGVQSIKFVDGFSLSRERKILTIDGFGDFPLESRFDLKGDIRFLTIKKSIAGEYYASFNVLTEEDVPASPEIERGRSIGLDVGIHSLAVASDGRVFPNPEFYEQSKYNISRLKKKLAGMVPNSNNARKVRQKLLTEMQRVDNRRKDYYLKQVNAILHTPNITTIFIEKLNVSAMMSSASIRDKLFDVGLGKFLDLLVRKGKRCGVNVLEIDAYYPSSKTCNKCGYVNENLTLNDRSWICPHCGTRLDRDLNAARNIRDRGLFLHKVP